jgi:hypothetical protein
MGDKMSDQQQTPPGWYPTPDGQRRYWDGAKWTDNFAPPPSAGEPPTPKRGGALKWVLLGLGLVLVLTVGSCIAFLSAVGNETSEALQSVEDSLETTSPDAPESDAPEAAPTDTPGADATSDGSGDQDNPVEVKEGAAFDIRGFSYAKGWKFDDSGFGVGIESLKVTNNRGEKDSALIDVKLWKGSEVLADVMCTSDPIFPDTTVTLNCISGDDLPKDYDKITVNDTF